MGTMVQTLAKRLHHLIVSIARLRKSNTFEKLLEAILYMVKIHSIKFIESEVSSYTYMH